MVWILRSKLTVKPILCRSVCGYTVSASKFVVGHHPFVAVWSRLSHKFTDC